MEQQSCIYCIFICLIGSCSCDQTTVINLGHGFGWNESMELCENKNGSIPDVTIFGNGFVVLDEGLQHSSECFWLRATYESVENFTDDTYPNTCCEILFKDANGKLNQDCVSCTGHYSYLCASGGDSIAREIRTVEAPWINASKYCSSVAQGLPTDTNTELKNYLQLQPFWINRARGLNLNPKISDGVFAFCFFGGLVHPKCPGTPMTFCINYVTSSGSPTKTSDLHQVSTSYESKDATAHTRLFSTSSANYRTTKEYLTDIPMRTEKERTFSAIHSSAMHSTKYIIQTEVTDKDVKDPTTGQTVDESTIGNGTLVGSLISASIAFVVIFTIIMIVFIKKMRRKKRTNDDTKSETRMNTRSIKKAQPQNNPSYDTALEDDFRKDTIKTTCPEVQIPLREHVVHTQIENVKQMSDNKKDDYSDHTSVDDKEPALYSMVQKGNKKKNNAEAIKQCEDSNSEYDKIDFEIRSVSDSSRNVSEKVNIHRLGHQEEQDAHVYNNADFSCKTLDKNGGSVYDRTHFSRIERSEYNITYGMHDFTDQTYEHV